jgi:hypothetical protein
MNNLLEFHARHGYYIKVQPLKSGSGYFAEFPATEKNPFVSAYIVEPDKITVTIDMEGKDFPMQVISCPVYASRALIHGDIAITSAKIKISEKLICYFDNKNKQTNTLDNIKLTEDERAKELLLLKLINTNILNANIDNLAKEYNVVDGYEVIKKMISKGGFCDV